MSDPFRQQQFLTVLDRDEADRRFRNALDLRPLDAETISLADAHGRVLAEDMRAPIDVPAFDRSNVDGFAVRAEDTFGASEDRPITLELSPGTLTPGRMPTVTVAAGSATALATGAVIPRGASAVVMVEYSEFHDGRLVVSRPAAPGENITWAGTDIGRGETVLLRGTLLTSRETSVLAALGIDRVSVVCRPRVAILSTGDEIQPPGEAPRPGCVFDSNQTVLADAVRELGGDPVPLGIVRDDLGALRTAFAEALARADAVLLSGGTSKGAGDVSYRVVGEFRPGIIAHGVALKPGKPLCLAVAALPDRRPIPVAVLPGFPTSAIVTFHEFVAPVLRAFGGRPTEAPEATTAILPRRVNSERGRTEFVLVGLLPGSPPRAIPLGKGSGSVTAFGHADGFIAIPRQREYLEAGETVEVRRIGAGSRPADLLVVGSHCLGLDYLLARLRERGFTARLLAVGSTSGLEAASRGDCDLAGIHLLDPRSDEYNRPFLTPGLELIPGYGRRQGVLFRPDDRRFAGRELSAALTIALADPQCVLANRNRGSGTRLLIDRLIGNARPPGFLSEARAHQAVAAAVAQSRSDWGVAIEPAAREYGLGFLELREERFDFVAPRDRLDRPAVRAFREVLEAAETRAGLTALGFLP